MTNKELSLAIRSDLKKAGYKKSDYSIRVGYAGYETSVDIRIKNPNIRKSEFEAVVMKYRMVDYDERTYEVLAGGNTFIFVEYEDGVLATAAKELIPTAEMVLDTDKYDGKPIAENDTTRVFFNKYSDTEWTLCEHKKDEKGIYEYSPVYRIRSAQALAIAMYRYKVCGTIYA